MLATDLVLHQKNYYPRTRMQQVLAEELLAPVHTFSR
jgi:hypothetical protein